MFDLSGFSFGGGGSNFSLDGRRDQWSGAFSESSGGQTFIADAWDSTLGFLGDGLNVYKDYLDITGGSSIPASGSPDQWAEQAQPVDGRTAADAASNAGIVPGVPNGVLLLAGAALAVVMLSK